MKLSYKSQITALFAILSFSVINHAQSIYQENKISFLSSELSRSYCYGTMEFFYEILDYHKKQGGIILPNYFCPNDAAFYDLKPRRMSLKESLDLINQKNPNYAYKFIAGTINLVPTDSFPQLLKTRIRDSTVSFTNTQTVIFAIERSPDLIAREKELNIAEGFMLGGLFPGPGSKPTPIKMTFLNKTVQEILNEAVKKQGRGIWVYREATFNGNKQFVLDTMTG